MTTINRITKQKADQAQKAKHKVADVNFMTPEIVGFYFVPYSKGRAEMLVELSEGEFMNSKLWGVTCSNNGKSYHELSKCFHSEDEAIEYINKLI